MAGRKTMLNKRIIDKICTGIKNGYSYKRALQEAGIPERTFYHWKSQGEIAVKNGESSGLLLQLIQSLEQAEEQVLMEHQRNIKIPGLDYLKKVTKSVETITDENGDPVEVTTITEEIIPPNGEISMMMLARRFPDKWGPKGLMEKEERHDRLMEISEMIDGAGENRNR